MITNEEFFMVHSLFKQGNSIRGITKQTGLNRRTITKKLKQDNNMVKKRSYNSKLDDFKSYIIQRVKDTFPKRISSPALLSELIDMGYTGKIRILSEFVSSIFKDIKPEEPVIRFETKPGQQMQVDWTTLRTGRNPLYCFLSVLGYSRFSFIYFTDNLRLDTFIDCHIKAFNYYGGITQTVLYDNLKSVMIKRNAYGAGIHKLNDAFLDFSKSLGFIPRLCMPYRPKTKGKVERFAGFLKQNFYYPLRSKLKNTPIDLTPELLNSYGSSWLETINQRIHGTTKKRPLDMFNEEKTFLMPLISYAFKEKHIELPDIKIASPSVESYEFLLGGLL